MKIQLAVDRVTLEEAVAIIEQAGDAVDIIELGTSLFLDYGVHALEEIKKHTSIPLLADFKTMDEAAYEFNRLYEKGATLATVMGASSLDTIRICQKVAQEHQREYMIDTMEISDEKMESLKEFDDAIICLHLPKDNKGNLQDFLHNFRQKHALTNRLAVAGGVSLDDMPLLKEMGIDIAIVGSAIVGSDDITEAAQQFKELT